MPYDLISNAVNVLMCRMVILRIHIVLELLASWMPTIELFRLFNSMDLQTLRQSSVTLPGRLLAVPINFVIGFLLSCFYNVTALNSR